MTLTPAIKACKKHILSFYESGMDTTSVSDAIDALLSVVAAEEGRKYEEMVKLVKEWQEAGSEFNGVSPGDPRWMEVSQRWDNACDALAQWEAL